jgi:hypothetical protein
MAPFSVMFKKTIMVLGVGILLVAAGGTLWVQQWTQSRLSLPTEVALAALESDANVEVTNEDWLVFSPRDQKAKLGLVFYPGAHCDVRGYAPVLRAIAEQGYLVVAVRMPLYLAILGSERATDVIAAYDHVAHWAIAGHSLGGTMASQYADRHPETIDGLIVWDSYPAGSLLEYEKPVWVIHRSGDDDKPPASYAEGLKRLPADARYAAVRGGNHMNFGDFIVGPAMENQVASIRPSEQQAQVTEATLAALDLVHGIVSANRPSSRE